MGIQRQDEFTIEALEMLIQCAQKPYVSYAEGAKLYSLGRNSFIELGVVEVGGGALDGKGGTVVDAGGFVEFGGLVGIVLIAVFYGGFHLALECHEDGKFAAVPELLGGAGVAIVLGHGADAADVSPGVEDYGSDVTVWGVKNAAVVWGVSGHKGLKV